MYFVGEEAIADTDITQVKQFCFYTDIVLKKSEISCIINLSVIPGTQSFFVIYNIQ